MQNMLGRVRRCVDDYHMIEVGDSIAVGVSGGKDSLTLLAVLAGLRSFYPKAFSLRAITIDMGLDGMDFSPVADFCRSIDVPYTVKKTEIGPIIFDYRKEKNPCSMCAKMRRGALGDVLLEQGCNKIALGHHYDDVIETFLMNLFNEGRVGCFAPKTYLSRKDLWMIRPLVFAPEKEIRRAVERTGLPVVKSKCPADGYTQRQATKEFLAQKERESSGFKYRIFGALRRSGVDGWGFPDKGADPIDQKEE